MKRLGALLAIGAALGLAGTAQAHVQRHLGIRAGRVAIARTIATFLPGSDPRTLACRRLGSATIACAVRETGYSHLVLGYDARHSEALHGIRATRIGRRKVRVSVSSWVFGVRVVRG